MSSNHSGPGPQDGVTWPQRVRARGETMRIASEAVKGTCSRCVMWREVVAYQGGGEQTTLCSECAHKSAGWDKKPEQTTPADDRVPEGRKDDAGKPNYELLPWLAVAQVQAVLDYGAKKYSAHGWRAVKGRTRYLNATLRHIFAYARGEDNDPESGLPHLAHAAASILIQLEKDDPDFAATENLRKARIARLGAD